MVRHDQDARQRMPAVENEKVTAATGLQCSRAARDWKRTDWSLAMQRVPAAKGLSRVFYFAPLVVPSPGVA